MGCKAITPHLVSLAKKLEGKPFHLIAAHNQRDTKENVVGYIKGKGLAADTPNVTVTSFGRHPKVKGNGYVPYYMVFDHTGTMVRHYMCGSHHGGDGLGMIEWVEKMLAKAPAIYLGREPFKHVADLADRVGRGKSLAKDLADVEKQLAAGPDDATRAELERIRDGVVAWRDREAAGAEAALATAPSTVVPTLEALAKRLKGTALAEPVAARIAALGADDALARAIKLEKVFAKMAKRVEKRKPCKACKRNGLKAIALSCEACRKQNRSALANAKKALDKALEAAGDVPFAATVKAYAERL